MAQRIAYATAPADPRAEPPPYRDLAAAMRKCIDDTKDACRDDMAHRARMLTVPIEFGDRTFSAATYGINRAFNPVLVELVAPWALAYGSVDKQDVTIENAMGEKILVDPVSDDECASLVRARERIVSVVSIPMIPLGSSKPADSIAAILRDLHAAINAKRMRELCRAFVVDYELLERVSDYRQAVQVDMLVMCRRQCQTCGAYAPRKRCGGCRLVHYCSGKCQSDDYPRHKEACQLAKEAAVSAATTAETTTTTATTAATEST